MADATYRLKPLEWRELRNDPVQGVWLSADTVFGSIDVEQIPGAGCVWRYCFDEYYDEDRHSVENVGVAKADAERFYLSRILPALEAT